MATPSTRVSAAVLIIGNEILSGRTQDTNLAYLAGKLNEYGIQIHEARVVPDVEAAIVAAVNELRARYDYVFTTGGIGPTHDDITADCISNRPLKKCSSNAPGSWISKKRIAQTGLRSDWSGHFGLFAGRFARSGRTYPMVHA